MKIESLYATTLMEMKQDHRYRNTSFICPPVIKKKEAPQMECFFVVHHQGLEPGAR